MTATTLALLLLVNGVDGSAIAAVRACWVESAAPTDCVGVTVPDCIAARPDGETTVGMVECIRAETAAWQTLMEEEYEASLSALRAVDATGDVAAPDLTREATLEAAQQAWLAFREAECRARYALWGMGTLRQVVGANCLMEETAERAVELREMREP